MTNADWPSYVEQFHDERAGITESILGRCHADGATPYEWLGQAVPARRAAVLDVACGNGPLEPIVGRGWIGVDQSEAELHAARRRAPRRAACRADAGAIPLRTSSADAVICCMGLMVISSVTNALREIVRVASDGAPIAVLVPARGPLTVHDRVRYARLLLALRITAFQYPNPAAVKDPARLLRDAGLTLVEDTAKRFGLTVTDDAAADLLIDSLYLPRTRPVHTDAAKRLVRSWLQTDLGIPLRRLVARRA